MEKCLEVKKRLNLTTIDELQTYYGLATRRGVNSVEEMKKNIWATFFDKISTDDKPQHGLCPASAVWW